MHSYQHNIKTFNSATRHLTRVERSLYRDLIELYYDTEKPLPSDNFDRLARLVMANSDEEKLALSYVLGEFFFKNGDFYVHSYCDEQIEKFYSNTTAKALAGKASAIARKARIEQRNKDLIEKKSTEFNSRSTDAERNSTNKKPVTSNHNKPVTNKRSSSAQVINNIKTPVNNFFETDEYLRIIESVRPELIKAAEYMRAVFTIFWRDKGINRDDWPKQWEKWVLDESEKTINLIGRDEDLK